jgi:hypothetical protein
LTGRVLEFGILGGTIRFLLFLFPFSLPYQQALDEMLAKWFSMRSMGELALQSAGQCNWIGYAALFDGMHGWIALVGCME